MIIFFELPKLEGKVGHPSFSHKSQKWTPCVHILHTLVCPWVKFSTLHPSFFYFALRIHPRTIQTWHRHCFLLIYLSLLRLRIFRLAISLFFPVTTCTRLGLGWFYRILWLHIIARWSYQSWPMATTVGPRCPTLPSMHGGGGSPFLFTMWWFAGVSFYGLLLST